MIAATRHGATWLASAVIASSCLAGCRSHVAGIRPPIDLLTELSKAERRAARPVDQAVRTDFVRAGDRIRPALVMDAPARVTYSIRMPERAAFISGVTLLPPISELTSVTIRLGLSDNRRYKELTRRKLDARSTAAGAWQSVNVDLSDYSG